MSRWRGMQVRRSDSAWLWNSEQMSLEVQNVGISGPKKKNKISSNKISRKLVKWFFVNFKKLIAKKFSYCSKQA